MKRLFSLLMLMSFAVPQFNPYDMANYPVKRDSIELATPVKAMFKSFLLPGWGQMQNQDHWWKSVMFAGIETIGITLSISYGSRAEVIRGQFEAYGDAHWTLERWYKNTKIIFPDRWQEILIGTHKLGLKIGKNYYYSDQLAQLIQQYSWSEISVIRDRDFYENIGKYDQFVGGWDDPFDDPFDSEGNWYMVKKGNVESIILTKHKDDYRDQRHESNLLKHYSRYTVSLVMFNHLVSGLEAAWTANKQSKIMPKLDLKYNPLNKWGVGGVRITYAW